MPGTVGRPGHRRRRRESARRSPMSPCRTPQEVRVARRRGQHAVGGRIEPCHALSFRRPKQRSTGSVIAEGLHPAILEQALGVELRLSEVLGRLGRPAPTTMKGTSLAGFVAGGADAEVVGRLTEFDREFREVDLEISCTRTPDSGLHVQAEGERAVGRGFPREPLEGGDRRSKPLADPVAPDADRSARSRLLCNSPTSSSSSSRTLRRLGLPARSSLRDRLFTT